MLALVKTALRVTTTAYDTELTMLIQAALKDLGLAGVMDDLLVDTSTDPLINLAVTIFAKRHFSRTAPAEYEALEQSYLSFKSLLRSSTGYTNWEA